MASLQSANNASAIQQWQYLQSIMQSGQTGSSQKSKGSDQAFDPFAGLGGSGAASMSGGACPPFSPETMNALIDAQAQSSGTGSDTSTSAMSRHQQKVFGQLDGDGDGSVTKAELETSFGAENKAISDYVMKKLDTDGDGAISKGEFAAGTKRGHRHAHGPKPGNAVDALMTATQGASSQKASNSDGTSTTTITYADGSKVSMTSAASTNTDTSTNGNASQSQSQANLLEQLIRLQSQLIGSRVSSSTSTTAVSV